MHCPAGSRQPVPTRLGFYALRAGSLSVGTRNHARDGVGGYAGNINTLALSFNWTCALPPSTGKRAAMKAALAALLGLDEASEMSRFTVTLLRAASSTEAGYAAQASALARYLALSSGAPTAAVERAAAEAQVLEDADAAAANDTTTPAASDASATAAMVESSVWAVRFEVTGSSASRLKHAASTAQAWRDELMQVLKAPEASDALREALGHLPGTLPSNRTDGRGAPRGGGHSGVIDSSNVGVPGYSNSVSGGSRGSSSTVLQGGAPYGGDAFAVVDPASVRGVVAAYRPRAAAWTSADPTAPKAADLLLRAQDPSAVHPSVPLAVSFNISAQVPSLSDADCVLSLAQRQALRRAILEALGVANVNSDVTTPEVSVQNFGVTTAARSRQHFQAPGLERGGKGGWKVAVVWTVALHVAVPSAVLQFDDAQGRADANFVQAADNDLPGPLGWRGGKREALSSPIFARHGAHDDEDFRTLVDPMERWAATVRNALSGSQFQLACEHILASNSAASTDDSASNGAASPYRATQVEVVNDSVRAQSAASFGWAEGWPPGYLVDDVDGKAIQFLDDRGDDNDDDDDVGGDSQADIMNAHHHTTHATSAPGWASEVYHTGGFAMEKPCEPGFWCENGRRHRCPAGRYGARAQSADPTCDGPCAAGYYCPAGSASPLAHVCSPKGGNPSVYCPAGSGAPVAVPRGYYSYGDGGGGTKTFAKPFDEVDTNHDGVLDWLEFSASGPLLEAAHAAAAASTSSPSASSSSSHGAALELRGGALGVTPRTTVTVVPGVYGAIPAEPYSKMSGSSRDNSDEGEKGVLEHALRHEARALWQHADRDTSGELDPREYYQGVVSVVGAWGAAYERPNGHLLASSGNAFRVDQDAASGKNPDGNPFLEVLPANSTRLGDARFSLAAAETRSFASPCGPGFYCTHGVRYPCPRGAWGASAMLDHPSCDGPCAPGYWCPEQSTSPYGESSTTLPPRLEAHECGNASVFCATGSKAPQRVFVGYYTLGGADHGRTRSSERRCTPGSYCSGDGVRRPCSKGFYGAGWGHTDRKCSGLCAAG